MTDMHERPSNVALIIAIVIFLVAVGFLIKMRSPTGNIIGIATTPCVDSDGEDPFMQGTVQDIMGNSLVDGCADVETVDEAYCEDNSLSHLLISCPVGKACVDGACQQ